LNVGLRDCSRTPVG